MMMWSQDGCLGLIDLDHVMVECLHPAPGPDIHQKTQTHDDYDDTSHGQTRSRQGQGFGAGTLEWDLDSGLSIGHLKL